MTVKFHESEILEEIARQDRKKAASEQTAIESILRQAKEDSQDGDVVDILDYTRAEWGLNEDPYPIQSFVLKLIFGLPLDDRDGDLVASVISPTKITCLRPRQFRRSRYVSIGDNQVIKIIRVDLLNKVLILEKEPEHPILPGDGIRGRIEVWDKFRENVLGTYNETEFFDFLYGEGLGSDTCNISISRQQYEERLGKQLNLLVMRFGRRGTKSSISQWVAAYFCYRILKKYHPQEYYQTRRDQPITITLIATTKNQAQDLLAPARAAIKRSPFLKRYIEHDDVRRIDLNTPYNLDHGLDSESGIKVKADPCSAKATRGPAVMLGLLEEFGLFMTHLRESNSSDKEIYTALAPAVADLKNPDTDEPEGLLLIISTPLTTETYMYEIESSIWDGKADMSNSMVIHLPSYWINPLLSTKSLKSAYVLDSDAFDQEFGANYSDQYKKAISRDRIKLCCVEPGDHQWLIPGEDTFMGFDLGGLRVGQDRTTFSIVAMNDRGKARLIVHEVIGWGLPGYEDYLDDDDSACLDVVKIVKRLDYLWDAWACRAGYSDDYNSYGIKSHIQSSARDGLLLEQMTVSKNDHVARNFLAYIEQRNVIIYAAESDWKIDQSLVRELGRLDKIQTGGMVPKIKLQAPKKQGMYDDQFSSFSRALYIAQKEVAENPPLATGPSRTNSNYTSARDRAEAMRGRRDIDIRTNRSTGPGRYRR